jgi:hypothetical protein
MSMPSWREYAVAKEKESIRLRTVLAAMTAERDKAVRQRITTLRTVCIRSLPRRRRRLNFCTRNLIGILELKLI